MWRRIDWFMIVAGLIAAACVVGVVGVLTVDAKMPALQSGLLKTMFALGLAAAVALVIYVAKGDL